MSIQELNQHPLNQAALKRLEKEREGSMSGLMHLLTLAYVGLPDDLDPFSREGKVMMDWTQDVWFQAAAMDNLEDALDADEVLELLLPAVAERIVETLFAASRS